MHGTIPNLSLPELLRRTASEFSSHPAIIGSGGLGSGGLASDGLTSGGSQDFATVNRQSDAIAARLVSQGVRKGDRVGLYGMNSDTFAVAYCGILKAGAVVVPISILLNPKEIAYMLNDSGARALFHADKFAEAVEYLRRAVPGLSLRISMGDSRPADDTIRWSDLLSGGGPSPTVDFTPAEDLAAILYTSGTTGHPKGAMLTHRNLVANTFSIREALQLEPGKDILLVVLPMFHSFAATVGMLFPLLHGCTFVPMPRFEPEAVTRAIEATRSTIFLGVPSMYTTFLRLPDEHVPRLASLRFCVSGGAALPVEVLERFETRFGKLIYEGDGPTECSPVTCVNPVGGKRKKGSVGLPIPNVEMKILDDEARELPRGKVGEICVRGPNVMKGYWNRPEETRASFFGDWFRTGDLGYEDDEDYFFIVDRKKDMIIVNGMNVYPRVVEEILYQFPPVREAAVVGEPHKLHGEIPVAYVTLKDGCDATAEQVRAFCLENLGRHEVPRKVFFLPELPKTASGKILKRELRKHGEIERGVDSREECQ